MTDREIQALLEREARLRAFVDHGPVLAFMKDDQLRYVYVNPHMEQTFGITLEDIRGRADIDWLPEATARSVGVNDRRVLRTGEIVESLEELPRPGGETSYWMVVKFPFEQADGRRFVGGVGLDVTVLERTRTRLAESERRYRRLVENAQGLICTHDMTGVLSTVNRAAREALGYAEHEMIGHDLRTFLTPDAREVFERYLERMTHIGRDAGLLFVNTKDGRTLAWQYHNVRVDDDGLAPYVLGHAQNVTELRDTQERLRELAMTDDLTGLHNRRGFFAHAARLMGWAAQHERPLAALYVDIDGLKSVNDQYGHEAGSAMIVAAADVLKQTFRAADVVARLGGDEMVVLAALSEADAPIITARLHQHLRNTNRTAALPCPLSLSIGLAHLAPGDGTTLDELVRRADAAMYDAKRHRVSSTTG